MKYSVIIPTYHRQGDLFRCLDALAHYFKGKQFGELEFQVEVVVSDDGRDQTMKALLSERYPWCRYLEGPSRGPAANRNHGAKHATGDWLVFTDDDCIPQEGWLNAYSSNSEGFQILEGKTLAVGERRRIDEESPINDKGGHLWSCNFAIRADLFSILLGFDEGFPFPAMEDIEFCERVKKLGIEIKFVEDAVIYHPWRLRKGFRFLNGYASSVAYYASLHSGGRQQFFWLRQIKTFIRRTRSNVLLAFQMRTVNGLFRSILLDGYAVCASGLAVARRQS